MFRGGWKKMSEKVKLGIIGAGRIGRLHARHLCMQIEGVEVAAVSDIFEKAASDLAAELGITSFFIDHRKILRDNNIDAVIICSSTDTHAGIIREAAEAGKHIFCEKPIALDLEEIDKSLSAVKKAGVILQIGFNRRFDPNHRRVRAAVSGGEIGDPHILRITSRDPSPPPLEYLKVSGGMFLDMTIHDFDMARFLIGSEVEEVYAVGAVRVNPEIGDAGDIDTAIITLKFENGVIGTIDNSRQAVYGYDQRVEVFGSKGMAVTENVTPNRVRIQNASMVKEDLPLNFFMERYIDSYLNEMNDFIAAVKNGTPSPVSGHDGKMPVLIGKAALKSLKEGRPVKIKGIG